MKRAEEKEVKKGEEVEKEDDKEEKDAEEEIMEGMVVDIVITRNKKSFKKL